VPYKVIYAIDGSLTPDLAVLRACLDQVSREREFHEIAESFPRWILAFSRPAT